MVVTSVHQLVGGSLTLLGWLTRRTALPWANRRLTTRTNDVEDANYVSVRHEAKLGRALSISLCDHYVSCIRLLQLVMTAVHEAIREVNLGSK